MVLLPYIFTFRIVMKPNDYTERLVYIIRVILSWEMTMRSACIHSKRQTCGTSENCTYIFYSLTDGYKSLINHFVTLFNLQRSPFTLTYTMDSTWFFMLWATIIRVRLMCNEIQDFCAFGYLPFLSRRRSRVFSFLECIAATNTFEQMQSIASNQRKSLGTVI